MRKKSHISLAKYIVEDVRVPELEAHRKAFYLGSILPDCKPSFLTQRHEFDRTFDMVKERICDLSEDRELVRRNARAYMRHLGEVIHYIADYFTFPHNPHYPGTLRDHCIYEEHLKKRLKEYIQSGEAERNSAWIHASVSSLNSTEAICRFIRKAHEIYVKRKNSVEEDCLHIVLLCHQVVAAVIRLIKGEQTPGVLPAAS